MKEKLTYPVYEFRPLPTNRKLLRYNNGDWIEDDGEYDICFITDDNNGAPFCYYVSLPYQNNQAWSWVDDGRWAGFISAHPNGNAWHYMSVNGDDNIRGHWNRDKHPNVLVQEKGSSKVCQKSGCCNGRGVEFHIGDPYIIAGLLRERESKKVVKFPKKFKCIYCGIHDLSKIDMSKQKA